MFLEYGQNTHQSLNLVKIHKNMRFLGNWRQKHFFDVLAKNLNSFSSLFLLKKEVQFIFNTRSYSNSNILTELIHFLLSIDIFNKWLHISIPSFILARVKVRKTF
jgi:hypothetical protein